MKKIAIQYRSTHNRRISWPMACTTCTRAEAHFLQGVAGTCGNRFERRWYIIFNSSFLHGCFLIQRWKKHENRSTFGEIIVKISGILRYRVVFKPHSRYKITPRFTECKSVALTTKPQLLLIAVYYAPPLIGGGIKRCFCLTSVCLTYVCRVHH